MSAIVFCSSRPIPRCRPAHVIGRSLSGDAREYRNSVDTVPTRSSARMRTSGGPSGGWMSMSRLPAISTGTYGSVLEILNHVIAADAGYLPRLKVKRPDWAGNDQDIKGLDELDARVD